MNQNLTGELIIS